MCIKYNKIFQNCKYLNLVFQKLYKLIILLKNLFANYKSDFYLAYSLVMSFIFLYIISY